VTDIGQKLEGCFNTASPPVSFTSLWFRVSGRRKACTATEKLRTVAAARAGVKLTDPALQAGRDLGNEANLRAASTTQKSDIWGRDGSREIYLCHVRATE
jgi:hypothetical protein